MIVLTVAGTLGALFNGPIWGLTIYYLFAVLRPQYLWKWVLPNGVEWSLYVALATLGATALHRLGFYPEPDMATRPKIRFTMGHLVLPAFALWLLLSYLLAFDQSAAKQIMIDYSKILLMMAASILIVRQVWHIWLLSLVSVLSLCYIAYEVNFMYALQNYMGIYHNGYGGLDNNGAGLMLAMGVPFCLFIWDSHRSAWRWFFAAMIPVLLHAILMTYSRGAMVALLAIAPVMYLRSRRKAMMMVAFIGVAIVIPILAGAQIRERFFSVQKYGEDKSAQSRFSSWRAGIGIAKDFPMFGIGPRNSPLVIVRYGADTEGRVIHSQYVQIAADNGFVGVALYIGLLGCSLWNLRHVRRATRSTQSDGDRRIYGLACAIEGSLLVFATGALFLSLEVFELPYLLIMLALQFPLALQVERENADAVQAVPVTKPAVPFASGPYPRPPLESFRNTR